MGMQRKQSARKGSQHRNAKRWLAGVLSGVVAAAACGESATGPGVEPGPDPSTGTVSDTLPADAPALPVPAGPFADVPATSDTMTVVRPYTGTFRPEVERALGDWEFWQRSCPWSLGGYKCGAWTLAMAVPDRWSHELFPGVDPGVLLGRLLLVDEDGLPVRPATSDTTATVEPLEVRYARRDFLGEALTTDIHLRRDRYWKWIPLSSGVGGYLIVTGDTEATLASTYTSGSSRTETEAFGRSVTVTAQADFGVLKTSVSGTISESYALEVEVSEESSETLSRTVRGSPGKQVRFMIWALVERYTFTDADGEPLTDPSYEFVPPVLHRRGVATALQATEFPLS